jgi:hypothetical protein
MKPAVSFGLGAIAGALAAVGAFAVLAPSPSSSSTPAPVTVDAGSTVDAGVAALSPRQEARLQARRAEDQRAAEFSAAAAAAGDVKALLAENDRLRRLVKRQDEELALLDVDRAERDGVPVPFPDDLPPRFTQQALLSAFNAAFAETGLKGGVTAVDCAEYPCVVWGEVHENTRDLMERLRGSPEFDAAYGKDGAGVSGWGQGEGKPELFAVTLTPQGQRDKNLDTRIRTRIREQVDAHKPASWPEAPPSAP